MKLINIGFPKCGTATIYEAMKKTGFVSVHSRIYNESTIENRFEYINIDT